VALFRFGLCIHDSVHGLPLAAAGRSLRFLRNAIIDSPQREQNEYVGHSIPATISSCRFLISLLQISHLRMSIDQRRSPSRFLPACQGWLPVFPGMRFPRWKSGRGDRAIEESRANGSELSGGALDLGTSLCAKEDVLGIRSRVGNRNEAPRRWDTGHCIRIRVQILRVSRLPAGFARA
jgi:hypothetical protein